MKSFGSPQFNGKVFVQTKNRITAQVTVNRVFTLPSISKTGIFRKTDKPECFPIFENYSMYVVFPFWLQFMPFNLIFVGEFNGSDLVLEKRTPCETTITWKIKRAVMAIN